MTPNQRKIYRCLLKSRGKGVIEFDGCIFDTPFDLRELIKHDEKLAGLLGCKILNDRSSSLAESIIRIESIQFNKALSARRCSFKIDVDFSFSTFSGKADFGGSTFSGGASFSGTVFSGEAHFYQSTFSEKAIFWGSTFSGVTHFAGSTFSGKTIFDVSQFSKEADFRISTFSGEANFYRSRFSGKTNFSGTTFSGEANFNRSRFFGKSDFSRSTFLGRTTIENTKFHRKADFGLTFITGTFSLLKNTYQAIDFKDAVVSGQFKFSPQINANCIANRKTATLFKHTVLGEHNNIAAMDYKAREMDLYREGLQKWGNEWWLLTLNRWSNEYGLNWGLGVGFTMGLALFFNFLILNFGLVHKNCLDISWADVGYFWYDLALAGFGFFLNNLSWVGIGYFWHDLSWPGFGFFLKGYIHTLNVLNFNDNGYVGELNAGGVALFFLSKIFVSYGIYQTVSAFRKHGRI